MVFDIFVWAFYVTTKIFDLARKTNYLTRHFAEDTDLRLVSI